MLRLKSTNGMAIFHLAKKAKKKIPMYEVRAADLVNVPFFDEIQNKTRYLIFYKNREGDWRYIETNDNPGPTHI